MYYDASSVEIFVARPSAVAREWFFYIYIFSDKISLDPCYYYTIASRHRLGYAIL